jgi:mRNA interferase RelE/StbE
VGRYRILIKPSAAGELERIGSKKNRRRIISRITSLSEDPRPRGCEKLSGRDEKYRARQGDFRIVYSIDDEGQALTIYRIGRRKDVYR